jgi:hypothetical protein
VVAIFVCNENLSCLPPVILNLPLQGIDCFIYVMIFIFCVLQVTIEYFHLLQTITAPIPVQVCNIRPKKKYVCLLSHVKKI